MRPDEHKKKESRRYQARKKNQGDATAAEVADRRRQAARARDAGTSVAAIRRRNGELPSLQQMRESAEATAKIRSSKFSRRKVTTNSDRYTEISAQDAMAQDAEMGVDRETTDLVAMLEKQDETESGATYFKFKDENVDSSMLEQQDQSMFQVNLDLYEGILGQVDCCQVLGLSSDDVGLVDAAFGHQPVMDKPIVPAFATNAHGLVLFNKKPAPEPKEQDGIYVRNERRPPPSAPAPTTLQPDDDDLDELLSLTKEESTPKKIPAEPTSKKIDTPPKPRPTLPRPSATTKKKTVADDDEAWLDDILG